MGPESPRTLVWFRRDLRLSDNPALSEALRSQGPVSAVYVHPGADAGPWAIGAASAWYLHHSLLSLQQDLARAGIELHGLRGSPSVELPALAARLGARRVVWNRVVEPGQESEDVRVQQALREAGRTVSIQHDDSLLPPAYGLKADGSPYRVFTPFWRHLQARLERDGLFSRLGPAPSAAAQAAPIRPETVHGLGLLPDHPWPYKLRQYWRPGESGAKNLLQRFLRSRTQGYAEARDFPALDGTSRLSPALHFGEISAARVYRVCRRALIHEPDAEVRAGLNKFLSELGWREFGRHLLYAFPDSSDESLDPRFERPGAWLSEQADDSLRVWQRGRTGVALVDAGMRQLWETGWMHNRVRMVAASFLTKNLGIHWIYGARWFWDTLVDADLASNSLGWQWVAGCGADAAPYYRIFNPELQAGRFDPQHTYRRRWAAGQRSAVLDLDLGQSRKMALERYHSIIQAPGP